MRVNIKQDLLLFRIEWIHFLHGIYSVDLPFVDVSFLCASQKDLPVKGNKENKFKNWLKYNNKCLIAFCTDRVQVPDPLQYSNDCIRNAPRSDEGTGEKSGRGYRTDRKEKVVMKTCLMHFAQKSCKSFRKLASSYLICWHYTISH